MNSRLQDIQQDYFRFLESIPFNTHALDYSIAEKHKKVLKSLDVVKSSSISVFDLNQRKHLYQSDNFGQILGYYKREMDAIGEDFITSKIHPDDHLRLLENGLNLMHYAYDLPAEHRKDFKLISDFRLKNADDRYVRVIEQQQALELDPQGNVWLALSILDISPDQDINKPIKCRLLNFKTGRTNYMSEIPNKYTNPGASKKLSKRELQILQLIKEGNFSKEIADKLFISVHTVNTHRQNILQKLEVANSIEAVQYAEQYGLFALIE